MESLTIRKAFWLLLLISVFTIIPFLGLSDFHTKGEPREAIVSYTMLSTGNWVLPVNNGGEIAYKPPFFHWCIAAVSFLNNNQVTEATSRMPSAIGLILMVVVGFLFLGRRKGVSVALLAAFITLTNFELHRAGVNCRVDMVLTALTVIALYSFYRWYEKGLKGVPWAAIICMSLATLTKGPVGTLIPCLVTGVFLLLRGMNFFKAFSFLFLAGLASLVIPGLWYFAAYQQGGKAFLDLILEENVGRMTNTMSYDSCVNPWYYNLITLLSGYVPWVLLVLISLFTLQYQKVNLKPLAWWNNLKDRIAKMESFDLFALTAIAVIFVFYCFPQSKRSVYLMPIYPFIAYFLAKYILHLSKKHIKVLKLYGGILAGISLLLFATFLVVKQGLIPETIFHGRHAGDNIDFLHAIEQMGGFGTWILVLLPTLLGLYWWVYSRKSIADTLPYALVVITMGLYLSLDGAYQPAVLNAKSDKPTATDIARLIPPGHGDIYGFVAYNLDTTGDFVRFFAINFYIGNRIGDFYQKRPKHGYLLVGEEDAKRFLPEFEKEGYRFDFFYKAKKRGCDVKQIAEIYKFSKE